jgi:hypothetical protein
VLEETKPPKVKDSISPEVKIKMFRKKRAPKKLGAQYLTEATIKMYRKKRNLQRLGAQHLVEAKKPKHFRRNEAPKG